MTRNVEREHLFKWVGPVFVVRNILVGRTDRHINIKSLDDAKKYRIGVIKDDVLEKYFLGQAFDSSKVEGVSTLAKNFDKLSLDRIDLIAHSEVTIRSFIKNNRLDSSLFKVSFVVSESPNYFAFSNDVSDSLVQRFQAALGSLNVQCRQIRRSYGLPDGQ
jgi:polar amino acid transport system substrate-binding protein